MPPLHPHPGVARMIAQRLPLRATWQLPRRFGDSMVAQRNHSSVHHCCDVCGIRYCGSCAIAKPRSVLLFSSSSELKMRRIAPSSRSFSSSNESSSGAEDLLPHTSPLYDPRTNEPAGLRQVLDGLKRMEEQVTNIENDLDALKTIVKKIRESNGTTEKRMEKIEHFADTMQQDLYLTMDMVRSLTDVLSESKTPPAPK